MQRNPHSYQIATGYRTFYSLSLIYQPITKKRLFFRQKYYDENTIDFKHLLLSEKNQSLLKDIQNSNSVGVHIRRGDYMTKQNLVIFGNICTQKYYHDAIRIITEKVNDAVFYVFLMILAGYKLIWIYPMLFM